MMQKRSLFRFDAWWLYTSRAPVDQTTRLWSCPAWCYRQRIASILMLALLLWIV